MTYLLRHLQVLFDTLGRMWRTPLPTLMTLAMLGIAMALPLVLHQLVGSLAEAAGSWRDAPRISLFLDLGADARSADETDALARAFARELLRQPAIDDIEYIAPRDALAEFKRVSGFGAALDHLPGNPLPPLLVVHPDPSQEVAQIERLVARLAARPEVDSASFDQLWLRRLGSILALLERGVLVFAALMALAVVLIIGNSVRLGVVARADEIEIIDQVGGSRAFIRRPFLYFGAMHGLLGALLACVIGGVGLHLLGQPAATLAALYQSDFRIAPLGVSAFATLALAAASLGVAVAWVTVELRLRAQARR
ncbi:MAG: permease-like cell division protein FtsX [bacterium]